MIIQAKFIKSTRKYHTCAGCQCRIPKKSMAIKVTGKAHKGDPIVSIYDCLKCAEFYAKHFCNKKIKIALEGAGLIAT